MMTALRIAATGMQAQQMNVDVLSNNISNVNTTAYKRQKAAFTDLMYQSNIGVGALTSATGSQAPTGAQVGLGVNIGSVYRINTQGNVNETGNGLDIAIQGRGYFRVQLPDGRTAYTRDGSFQVNQDGQIVNKDGYLLDPNITVPPDATQLTISDRGIVSAKINEVITQLGEITLSMFVNEAGLENIGDNLALETQVSGAPTDTAPTENGSGGLLQYYLEGSNVDPIEAVTSLITAQRAYELNSRVIATADEMLNAVNQIR